MVFAVTIMKLKMLKSKNPVIIQQYAANNTLCKVGNFISPKNGKEKYETGQLFLHRVFCYRGIILFPWLARIHDRDIKTNKEEKLRNSVNKESAINTHTFYQVLIDSRDCPYIRTQTEAVTFLGNSYRSLLYSIPGVDYVAHEDVIPYSPSDKQPMHHELFDKLLVYNAEKESFVAQEPLKAWQRKNLLWLELSDVHRETTEGIRVTAIPFYMGCRDKNATIAYWWRYCIRLENFSDYTVQLRERHWRIFSLCGTLGTVRGRGVVGQEPILTKKSPAFQYSSHVSLQSPNGHMWGTFRMEREDGVVFNCRIPPFPLESKLEKSNPHIANPGFL